MSDTVLVVGTGTIGEPLISLLLNLQDKINFDNLIFYKHTPRISDRPMMKNLKKKGGLMCVRERWMSDYEDLGVDPDMTFEQALEEADVVADATRKGIGLENKETFYERFEDNTTGFLGQGSEKGFGTIYVAGVNDRVFEDGDPQYIQIASCNTHAASAAVEHLGCNGNRCLLDKAEMTFIRRASDVSETQGVQSPTVAVPENEYGTHHAEDVCRVFETKGIDLDAHSTALKVSSQYMHSMSGHFTYESAMNKEDIIEIIYDTPSLAMTNKEAVNLVFSFGRDHGHLGRILNQSVIVRDSIQVKNGDLYFWSFTPQDGNAILSSIKALTYWLHGKDKASEVIDYVEPWLFTEV